MKIVVVSDNHGRTEPLEQILELHRMRMCLSIAGQRTAAAVLQGMLCQGKQ